MSPGQYNEYLRAMQRVMEDGISKGFLRSSDQVAQNLTMLSQMTGNSPLWQGENGARRLMDMNAGLEATTGLKSSSDILVYRAAQQIAEKYGLGDSYVDILKIQEQGISGKYGIELFNRTMALNYQAEGGGREAIVERTMQQLGLNKYTPTDDIVKSWFKTFEESGRDIDKTIAAFKAKGAIKDIPLPNASSPELEWAQLTAQTANITVQTGQIQFDKLLPELLDARKKAEEELRNAGKKLPESVMGVMGGMADMPIFNEMGMPGGTFREKMEEAKNAPPESAMNQAYQGLIRHFSELTPERNQTARNLGYYPTMWYEAQGDPVKMWDILQRRGNVNLVNSDDAIKGLFDYRGDSGAKKFFGSLTHVGDNDSAAIENLRDLQDRTKIDSPDYDYLMRAYSQLAAFEAPQREEADRNNSLNAILRNNELTAQKLYDAVTELARNMGVRIVYE
jgi:hypothetical protein